MAISGLNMLQLFPSKGVEEFTIFITILKVHYMIKKGFSLSLSPSLSCVHALTTYKRPTFFYLQN